MWRLTLTLIFVVIVAWLSMVWAQPGASPGYGITSSGSPSNKWKSGTIAANDTTPSISTSGVAVWTTSANTDATAITDLDNGVAGQWVLLIGGSNTNSSTIADSGNFNLDANKGAMTLSLDAWIWLYIQADNDYIEIGRGDDTSADAITVPGASGLTVGTSIPFADSTGTLTLQNIDAVDSTTESTIEAAIDTCANLTSIQSQTVSLAGALTVEAGGCTCNQDVSSDASASFASVTVGNTGIHVLDTNASHDLILACGSDLTADHTLTITTGDSDRSMSLAGTLTVESAGCTCNQDTTSDASPSFAGLTLGSTPDFTFTADTFTAHAGSSIYHDDDVRDVWGDDSDAYCEFDTAPATDIFTCHVGSQGFKLDGTGSTSTEDLVVALGNTGNQVDVTSGSGVTTVNASTLAITAGSFTSAQFLRTTPTTLTPTGANPTQNIDWTTGQAQNVDNDAATGCTVTFTFTAPTSASALLTLRIQQAAAACAWVWPGTVRWPSGTAPSPTATNNAIDIIMCDYDGTNYNCDWDSDFKVSP